MIVCRRSCFNISCRIMTLIHPWGYFGIVTTVVMTSSARCVNVDSDYMFSISCSLDIGRGSYWATAGNSAEGMHIVTSSITTDLIIDPAISMRRAKGWETTVWWDVWSSTWAALMVVLVVPALLLSQVKTCLKNFFSNEQLFDKSKSLLFTTTRVFLHLEPCFVCCLSWWLEVLKVRCSELQNF